MLNSVDFPMLGTPTMPILTLLLARANNRFTGTLAPPAAPAAGAVLNHRARGCSFSSDAETEKAAQMMDGCDDGEHPATADRNPLGSNPSIAAYTQK
jgi:hypothetical protein